MNKKIMSLILAPAMILSVFTAAPFTMNAEKNTDADTDDGIAQHARDLNPLYETED